MFPFPKRVTSVKIQKGVTGGFPRPLALSRGAQINIWPSFCWRFLGTVFEADASKNRFRFVMPLYYAHSKFYRNTTLHNYFTLAMHDPLKHNKTMNKLDSKTREQVIGCLIEGCSIRATVRMTDAAKKTVMRVLVEIGEICADY